MDEVDVEGARDCAQLTEVVVKSGHWMAQERPELPDRVRLEALELGGHVGEPVARQVHLVAPLREPPSPTEEVDRAPVPHAEDPERFRRHVAEC